ncbi:unnamed protein product, partial [Laminaria digitata]
AASAADASSCHEGPGEGELVGKGRASEVAAATTERDCEPHSNDDDADNDGGGGGDGGVGDVEEVEEEEEAGSDLERDFGGIVEEPRRHSATSANAVDQPPAASTTESSDSDESSGSVGAAALEFELFLGTIKGGVGGEGGSNMNAEGVDNDESEADDMEALLEASPQEGAGDLAREGGLSQGEGEVRPQEPVVVEDLVHSQALTPSKDGGGAASAADASSSDEGPGKGKLGKGRASGVAAVETERDYEPRCSDDNADGGGGGDDDDA